MITLRRYWFLLAIFVATCTTLPGADITGTWKFLIHTAERGDTKSTLIVRQTGQVVDGKYESMLGSLTAKGTCNGDMVKIEAASSWGKILINGTLGGDGRKLTGTVDVGKASSGTFVATRN